MSDNTQERQTLVEEGTEVSGTMRAKCKIVVRGTIEGELEAPAVDITDTGSVTGTLRAKEIRSQGAVAGTVEVETITIAGRVHSNTVIRAETLEVSLSRNPDQLEATFGDCVLEVGEMPSDQPQDDDTAAPDATEVPAQVAADKGAPAEDKGATDGDPAADASDGKRSRKRRRKKGRGDAAQTEAKAAEGDDASASGEAAAPTEATDGAAAPAETAAAGADDAKSETPAPGDPVPAPA